LLQHQLQHPFFSGQPMKESKGGLVKRPNP